jgi:Flp pilus assembly protein TadD
MRAIERLPPITAVVLLAAMAAVAGCKRVAPPGSASAGAEQSAAATPTTARASATTISEAERHFGVSPTFNKDVEYQPAVIVMEHGADAIGANSSD